jgi:hypothetical protein
MPKLGLGLSLPQTRAASASPIPSDGLSLWLKADAGVTSSTVFSYNYKSNIALSSAGQTTINGNYTPSSVPAKNSNYILFGPNNNRIEVRPNSSPIYRLYNTDNYIDGGPLYYDFTSNNGTTWSLGDGKRPVSITISGLTGPSSVANGAYGPFEGVNDESVYWFAENSTNLGVLKVYTNGDCELLAFSSSFFIVATGSNWGIGSFTPVLPGTGSPTGSGTIYPTGGVPTGVVTTTTINTDNVTAWADQSGNGNNANVENSGEEPTFVSSFSNSKPAIQFDGVTQLLNVADSNSLDFLNTSIFIVLKRTGVGIGNEITFMKNGDALEDAGSYWQPAWLDGENMHFSVDNGGSYNRNSFVDISDGIARITDFTFDGTDFNIYVNGVQTATYNDQVGNINITSGSLQIGGYNQSFDAAEYFNGQIAEVIMYNRAVTTTERQQVEAYLNTKYAIY